MPPSSPEKTPIFKVIDFWAVPAWLRNEPAAARVNEVLMEADAGNVKLLMSWINVGEVYYMLKRKHDGKVAQGIPEAATIPPGSLGIARRRGHNRRSQAQGHPADFVRGWLCRSTGAAGERQPRHWGS